MAFCSKCGATTVNEGDAFCSKCGTRVSPVKVSDLATNTERIRQQLADTRVNILITVIIGLYGLVFIVGGVVIKFTTAERYMNGSSGWDIYTYHPYQNWAAAFLVPGILCGLTAMVMLSYYNSKKRKLLKELEKQKE